MKILATLLVLFTLLGGSSSSFAETPACEIPTPVTSSFILSLEGLPRTSPIPAEVEACYWGVVKGGLAIVPDLLALVTDATITRHRVPLFGGSYAAGDIAVIMTMDIVQVPVLDMVYALDPEANGNCGFCAYWDFMHEIPSNRILLQAELASWFTQNRGKLVWREMPNTPEGGRYEVVP